MPCSSLICQLRSCQHPLCLPVCPSFLTDMLWLSRGSGNCTMGSMQNPSTPASEQAHSNLTALPSPDSIESPQHASPTPCQRRIASVLTRGCRPCFCSLERALVADVVFTGSIQAKYVHGCAMHMVACSVWSSRPVS